jgi:flagellar biosynthesis/type III secretory pathway chaperone
MVDEGTVQRLQDLGEALSCALDSEFNSLKERNVPSLEEHQTKKVSLLEEILAQWAELSPDSKGEGTEDEQLLRVKALLKSCKEKHERNDIILRRQIDEVKTLLDNLLTQKNKASSSVYNKMGKMIS